MHKAQLIHRETHTNSEYIQALSVKGFQRVDDINAFLRSRSSEGEQVVYKQEIYLLFDNSATNMCSLNRRDT